MLCALLFLPYGDESCGKERHHANAVVKGISHGTCCWKGFCVFILFIIDDFIVIINDIVVFNDFCAKVKMFQIGMGNDFLFSDHFCDIVPYRDIGVNNIYSLRKVVVVSAGEQEVQRGNRIHFIVLDERSVE